jgi:hypothetical protein
MTGIVKQKMTRDSCLTNARAASAGKERGTEGLRNTAQPRLCHVSAHAVSAKVYKQATPPLIKTAPNTYAKSVETETNSREP